MFVLWSRTSSSSVCRCRTCIDATHVLLRSPLRGSRHVLRRKRRFADVFTACYTGIFAAATLIDTSRKDVRRHKLERELEDARTELAILQDESSLLEEKRKADLAQKGEPSTPNVYQALATISMRDRLAYDRLPEQDPCQPVLDHGFDCASVLTRAALCARVATDWRQLERRILGEEDDNNHWQRVAITPLHLTSVEDTVARCVDKMLYFITYGLYWNNGCPEVTPAHLRPALRRIWEARHEGYPRYALDRTNGIWFNREMLRASYADRADRDPLHTNLVTTICYNLLVFEGEPRISIFNMLIAILDRLGLHRLSKVVIGKFFHDMVIVPTEMTTSILLNHYKVTREAWSFYKIIRGMVARRKVGHKIWRKKMVDMLESERAFSFQQRARALNAGKFRSYVIARATASPSTINAVLEGLLRFEHLHHAVDVFVAALQDSITVSARLFALLLDHCLAGLDWQAAVRLVAGMAAEAGKMSELLTNRNAQHVLGDRVERVLDLAGLSRCLGSGVESTLLRLFGIDESRFRSLRLALRAKELRIMLDNSRMGRGKEAHGYQIHEPRPLPDETTVPVMVKWSKKDVRRLEAYGLSQQVDHLVGLTSSLEQEFVDSVRVITISINGRRALVSRPGQLGFVVRILARLVDRAERELERLGDECRTARISIISHQARIIEADLLPLRERLATVKGMATLRHIQLAELEGLRIETEILRMGRVATELRLRAVEAETRRLRAEVFGTARVRPAAVSSRRLQNEMVIRRSPGSKDVGDTSRLARRAQEVNKSPRSVGSPGSLVNPMRLKRRSLVPDPRQRASRIYLAEWDDESASAETNASWERLGQSSLARKGLNKATSTTRVL